MHVVVIEYCRWDIPSLVNRYEFSPFIRAIYTPVELIFRSCYPEKFPLYEVLNDRLYETSFSLDFTLQFVSFGYRYIFAVPGNTWGSVNKLTSRDSIIFTIDLHSNKKLYFDGGNGLTLNFVQVELFLRVDISSYISSWCLISLKKKFHGIIPSDIWLGTLLINFFIVCFYNRFLWFTFHFTEDRKSGKYFFHTLIET